MTRCAATAGMDPCDCDRCLPADRRDLLAEALDLAAEAIPYAGPYFDEKWSLTARLAELRTAAHRAAETCVRCGDTGPFNSRGWCQDCASPNYT